ncbi:hypothetical protein LJC72_01595 [Bacteroides sp. OttesenSCG-928-D19]|nr:hypothetical protein [Bacteroides sp. OttesenSCG-928-D19]
MISHTGNLQSSDSLDFSKMYLVGQAYEGLLRYKNAYDCYKKCYGLDSTRMDLLNALARMAVNLGKANEAELFYKRVLEADSTDFYANYQLARLYVALDRYADGLKHYDLLLEKDMKNPVILRAKGDCYTRMDSVYPALDCYYNAYYNNVENAPLAVLLINSLLNLYNPMFNDYAEVASAACDTALFYHPANKPLRQKKAMIYYLEREYVKADSIYTSLMADKDSSYVTLKYCGCARYYARKWFDAIEPLEKAYEKDSMAHDVCLLLGISIGRTFDPGRAFQYFDRAEELLKPDAFWSDALIQFRAEMYVKTGQCNKGSELFYQLWKKEKKQLAWLQNIQFCYARQGDDISEEDRQRLLFISYLYASELLARPKNSDRLTQYIYLRTILKKYDEEMFFRGVESLPMLSPDNKKNTLSREKLKALLEKIPEE